MNFIELLKTYECLKTATLLVALIVALVGKIVKKHISIKALKVSFPFVLGIVLYFIYYVIFAGNPFANGPDGGKSKIAIEGCLNPDFKPVCSPYTAAAHTRCIETIQTYPIYSVNAEYVRDTGDLLYVDGLTDATSECYEKEIMLDELEIFDKWVK